MIGSPKIVTSQKQSAHDRQPVDNRRRGSKKGVQSVNHIRDSRADSDAPSDIEKVKANFFEIGGEQIERTNAIFKPRKRCIGGDMLYPAQNYSFLASFCAKHRSNAKSLFWNILRASQLGLDILRGSVGIDPG
jgi:hypothetical protein